MDESIQSIPRERSLTDPHTGMSWGFQCLNSHYVPDPDRKKKHLLFLDRYRGSSVGAIAEISEMFSSGSAKKYDVVTIFYKIQLYTKVLPYSPHLTKFTT